MSIRTVWENPWVRAGLLIAALVLLCFGVYALSFVLIPLLLAFLVAYVLDPVVDQFEARKISRSVAIGILALIGLGILLCIPLLIWNLVEEAEDFSSRSQQVARQDTAGTLGEWVDWVEEKLPLERVLDETGWREEYENRPQKNDPEPEPGAEEHEEEAAETPEEEVAAEDEPDAEAAETPDEEVTEEEQPAVTTEVPARAVIAWKVGETVRANILDWVRDYGGTAAATGRSAGASLASFLSSIGAGLAEIVVFFGNLAVFSFVGGFLLRDYDYVVAEIGKLVPPKYRETVFRIMGKIDEQLRNFIVGQGTVCLALAVMYWIGLSIAGVPFAFAIALFGGFATLIPFFGVILTFLPSIAFSLMYDGVGLNLVYVCVVFAVVQGLEGNVVTPFIMGQRVGLHPVWVILAVIVFGSLLGFMGLLIAVPLAAVLKVLVVEGVDAYKASSLFDEDKPPPRPRKRKAKKASS